MNIESTSAVIVGSGPARMMLATELTLADINVIVIERRPTQELDSPRSRGLHSRTIKALSINVGSPTGSWQPASRCRCKRSPESSSTSEAG